MKRILGFFLVICAILIYGSSCRQWDLSPSWNIDVIAPILKSSLGISNFVADSLIQINTDNTVTIVFKGNVVELTIDTLVQIPDTTVQQTFALPFGSIKLGPGEPIPTLGNNTDETKYDLQPVELTKVIILSGSVSFVLTSSIQEVTELSYQMPGATKGGVPLSINEQIPAGTQANKAVLIKSFDLGGYEIDLKGLQGNDFNTIVANFTAKISPAAVDSVTISAGDLFDIKYSFEAVKTKYALGYFGKYTIVEEPAKDTLDVLKNVISGAIDLDSIGLKLNVQNGFGVDAQIILDMVKSVNSDNGNQVLLSHSAIGNAINLTRAIDYPTTETPFTYSTYNLAINSSNSNAEQFIENLPDEIEYSYTLLINPFGNNSNGNDFLYYNSDFRVNLDLEFPASFSANGLTVVDTVAITLSEDFKNSQETSVKGGFLYLYADNGFPYEATIQVYLYDGLFNITDSLISPSAGKIDPAPVDINYKVSNKQLSRIDIPVNEAKMQNLKTTSNALVKVVFSTKPDNVILKIYSDYVIDLKLVGDLTYRVNIK